MLIQFGQQRLLLVYLVDTLVEAVVVKIVVEPLLAQVVLVAVVLAFVLDQEAQPLEQQTLGRVVVAHGSRLLMVALLAVSVVLVL
jgi:hypothetical protein